MEEEGYDAVKERLLGHITGSELREGAKRVLDGVWETFQRIPASKTGKYHPEECNRVPYGLVNHTLRVVWLCRELCREEGLTAEETDLVVTAAVIHDVGKVAYHDSPWEDVDHGRLGAELARKAGLPEEVAGMVERHMGHWDGKVLITVMDRILAYADYIASRPLVDIISPEARV